MKSSIPIIKHINDFLDWVDIEKGLSSKSQQNYGKFLSRFIFWLEKNNLEKIKPHELTLQHVWDYRVFLARQYSPRTSRNLKKSTQNYYLIALRALLGYFSEKEIDSVPVDKIKLAKAANERVIKFLSIEQLEKLFSMPDTKTISGLRDRAILEAFFSTGMRIAELVSLNREQFKFHSPITKDLEIGIVGKGERPRTIYFSAKSLNWLEKYLKTRDDEDKALFINYRSRKDSSRRLTPRAIEKLLKRYAILAGLPENTTPHVMRHSFATDLLSQGVDIRTLQEFLGHKNIAATQIYAHVTNKRLREIHEKFHSGKTMKN